MMEAILEVELPEENAAVFDKYMAGIKIMQRQMEAEQREIEAIRAETKENIKDIMQMLMAK
jgi:hypothetical protein